MTIEALLEEQNTLLKEQTTLLKDLFARLGAPTIEAKAEATQEVKAEAKKTKPVAEKTEVKAEAAADEAKAETSPTAVTYDDVKNAITAVVKSKGRDAGVAILAGFGVTSATALVEDQWQAVLEACKGAL